MKELVAERIPPGDRWTLLESESDIFMQKWKNLN